MKKFKTKIDSCLEEEYDFECYENTEPIEIGDKYIYFFCDIADVQECCSENEKFEINFNNHVRDSKVAVDLVVGFWKNCYKIKSTNFDLSRV